VDQQPYYEKGEKDEKFNEKEFAKEEEKSAEEKWRRNPLSSMPWAAILIWAGVVFLAENLGFSFVVPAFLFGGSSPDTWMIVLASAGVIMLLGVLARLLIPAYRRPVGGELVMAAILFGIVFGALYNWNLVWGFILIAIGISVLLRSFTSSRR
jgi:hypothetical protein